MCVCVCVAIVDHLDLHTYNFSFSPIFSNKIVPPLETWAQQVRASEVSSSDGNHKTSGATAEGKMGKKRKMIPCWNPGNGAKLCEDVPSMTREEVEHRVRVARGVQESVWRLTSFDERRRVLNALLDSVLRHKHEICVASCMDSGKSVMDAYLGEILTSCEKIRWLVNNGEQYLLPERRSPPLLLLSKRCYVEYRPVGVVGMIVPW